jgi:hypothetical protein
MPQVQASQHLYANVEADQSPRGRGGFQTLFHTQSELTESEISEMEGRLPYYPSESEPVKRLFFRLSTGKVVVGQIVPLKETDSAGRKGRYLAHSLLFAPEEFARLDADPFRVLRHFRFATSVREALDRGDFRAGNAEAAILDLPAEAPLGSQSRRTWALPDLARLVLLALRAQSLAAERVPVAFLGRPEEVEGAVATAWPAIPTPLRTHCSFDTYFYRCNLVATFYWGVGLLDEPANPNLPVVEAAGRTVRKAAITDPGTAYERWIIAAVESGHLLQASRHRDLAFAVCRFLEGQDYEPSQLDSAAAEMVQSVFETSLELVRDRLQAKIGELLPPKLAGRAFEHVRPRLGATQVWDRLRQGFEVPELLEALHASYESQQFSRPDGAERTELGQLLATREHRGLALLLACWSGRKEQLRVQLSALEEGEYREFVHSALSHRLTDPWTLLVEGRGQAFVSAYFAATPRDKREVPALVEALLATRNADCLPQLRQPLSELSARELRRVAGIVAEDTTVPPAFGEAVTAALEALPPPGGVTGALRKLFRR